MGQAQKKTMARHNAREIDMISAGDKISGTAGNGKRRSTDSGERKEIELWDISGDDGNPCMMRLAEPAGSFRKGRDADRLSSIQARRNVGHRPKQMRSARPRSVQAVKRRRAKRRKVFLYRIFALFMLGVCLILIYQTTGAIYCLIHNVKTGRGKGIVEIVSDKIEADRIEPPEIIVDYLDVNDYSRPGTKLKKVKNIFVHYTANPGTSAQQNRSYFANLAKTKERSASAHFIIGYEGELIQCIPLEEQAYAVATRNGDSVSIECCYLDEDGKFTQATYDTLVHTLAWLCREYRLSTDDILRHYDCGGKLCPLYYVEHEDAWEKLLADVKAYEDPSES